ncbi:MAG: hypothetical protein A2004_03895 [Spirochaetes bacterium GWC1_61_12]|nr:MAG: hypothetical protein A2004_03895 [Spirochaetes bacterium GWC1_61_12]
MLASRARADSDRRWQVASDSRMACPFSLVSPSRREATLTVSPMTAYWALMRDPWLPAKTGPECRPSPMYLSIMPLLSNGWL